MAVTIIKQPVDITAIVGTTAKFAVIAEGDIAGYQWQLSKDNGATFATTTMVGNKTPVMEVPVAESRNGYMYRCVLFSSTAGQIETEAATLTVINVGFVNHSTLQGIADAIRAKTETTDKILPADMAGLVNMLILPPDSITEIETVECAGSNTYTLTVPCGLSDTPACVAIYRTEVSSNAWTVQSAVWAHDMLVFWYGSGYAEAYANAAPLSSGVLTLKAYVGTTNPTFNGTYYCVMWR